MRVDASRLNIDPEKMRDLDCNLVEISLALKMIFDKLDNIRDKDLTLVIGRPKCGKSTTLTYLAFGPEHLYEGK